MRTLAITQNITVDGSIEMLGSWFDPQGQGGADSSDLLEELHRQDREADGFLVGRRTFEDLRGYWPEQADDPTGIAEYLDRVQKYVVSSTLTDPVWQPTTVLRGDPVEAVRALKEEQGQDIVVTGSITLCHTLVEAGLVDEYRLFAYPVVQGRGRRLFPDGFAVPRLELVESRAFRSGITYSRYVLPTGRPSRLHAGRGTGAATPTRSTEADRPSSSTADDALAALVGAWRTTGQVLGDDGRTVVAQIDGSDTYDRLGERLLVHRIDVRMGDDHVEGLEVIGPYDPSVGGYRTRAFDSSGTVQDAVCTVAAGRWTFGADGARSTLRIADDGRRMEAEWVLLDGAGDVVRT